MSTTIISPVTVQARTHLPLWLLQQRLQQHDSAAAAGGAQLLLLLILRKDSVCCCCCCRSAAPVPALLQRLLLLLRVSGKSLSCSAQLRESHFLIPSTPHHHPTPLMSQSISQNLPLSQSLHNHIKSHPPDHQLHTLGFLNLSSLLVSKVNFTTFCFGIIKIHLEN